MAETYVSAGVYARERDFSYYVSNVGQSSLGLVGETQKGQAFEPTLIKNMSEFREKFGDYNQYMPAGYCASSYFKYANQAYVVRVLGSQLLHQSDDNLVFFRGSKSGTYQILATMITDGNSTIEIQTNVATSGNVGFSASSPISYTGTVNFTSVDAPNYIANLFPRTNTAAAGAVIAAFPKNSSTWTVTGSSSYAMSTYSTPLYEQSGYTNARTPMIVSDISAAGQQGRNLFTIYTIGDGLAANSDIKIAIENIDYTAKTFDIVVRDYADTDTNPIVLERFNKLTMSKTATTYVEKAIGDSRDEDTSEYPLISKYIYIGIEAGDHTGRVPCGYSTIKVPQDNLGYAYPTIPVKSAYTASVGVSKQWLGVDYDNADPDQFMVNFGGQWKSWSTTGSTAKGFHLESGANATYYQKTSSAITQITKAEAKFLVPVLGGHDGWSREEEHRYQLTGTPTAANVIQWKAAIDTLSNTEEFDLNLLAVPGVALNTSIGTYAKEMCETRADTFYVGDMPDELTTATAAANIVTSIDSNYMATYWPYVKIYDEDNAADVWIPPTPQVLETLAYTDSVAYPWFAPAGMNRGLLTDVIKVKYRLSQTDRDTLYEGKVNPIATFPGQGTVIWGQKTLQTRTTALDRVNVRRMMLYIRKVIAGATKYLVFEQNDEATWDRFKAMVQPVLDLVKIKRGLYDFRVIMDETTNTPDIIDRNTMVGQIYIKPTKTAEAITINFNIMPTGAVFEE